MGVVETIVSEMLVNKLKRSIMFDGDSVGISGNIGVLVR
jgi:hypothetical protein